MYLLLFIHLDTITKKLTMWKTYFLTKEIALETICVLNTCHTNCRVSCYIPTDIFEVPLTKHKLYPNMEEIKYAA